MNATLWAQYTQASSNRLHDLHEAVSRGIQWACNTDGAYDLLQALDTLEQARTLHAIECMRLNA